MIAEEYDSFLFDLDGVLYRGDDPIPEAAPALARLRSLGKGMAFVTNNSGRTPEQVAERLRSVGVAAEAREVETSALTTATVLAERGIGRAFVVGGQGVRIALADAGVEVIDGEPEEVDAVVVGWDRSADYTSLRVASVLVQRGASLVATNADASFPAADGMRWPGAGALLAAIETTTGIRGDVIGKPHPPLLLAALDRAGGGRPLLVGDRLDTDIAGAAELGWDSLLVLTGISSRSDVETSDVRPTHVAVDLTGLFAEPEPPEVHGDRDPARGYAGVEQHRNPKGRPMIIDDLRRTVEGLVGTLTPAKAQQLAKDMLEPGAAKEQVAKTTADLLEWSHANRERMSSFVRREISEQLKAIGGVASQAELDALKKRVRDLERAAGMTASGKAKGTRSPAKKRSTAKSTAKSTASRAATASTSASDG